MSTYAILSSNLLINVYNFRLSVLISTKRDVNYFLMVQIRRCSDHKKLHDSVHLFSVFHSLAFEEMEPIITGCQSY